MKLGPKPPVPAPDVIGLTNEIVETYPQCSVANAAAWAASIVDVVYISLENIRMYGRVGPS